MRRAIDGDNALAKQHRYIAIGPETLGPNQYPVEGFFTGKILFGKWRALIREFSSSQTVAMLPANCR